MADSQVDRPVLFTLVVQADESAMTSMEAFGKKAAAIQKQITAASAIKSKPATSAPASGARAIDSVTKARERSAAAAEKEFQADLKALKGREQAARKTQLAIDKATDDAEKVRKQAATAAEKAATAIDRGRQAEQKAIDTTQRNYDTAAEQARSYGMSAKAAFSEVGMGALQAGRGFAMLGLGSKESSEEMVKGLVKIQGAYDILKGGFEVWRKLSEGMRMYRKATAAAAVAENAFAAARARNAAIPPPVLGAAALGTAGMVAGGAVAAGGLAAAGALMTPWGQRKANEQMQKHGTDEEGMPSFALQGLAYLQTLNPVSVIRGRAMGEDYISPLELRREIASGSQSIERTKQLSTGQEQSRIQQTTAADRIRAKAEAEWQLQAIGDDESGRATATRSRQQRGQSRRRDRAATERYQSSQQAARSRFDADVAGGNVSAYDRQRRDMRLTEQERNLGAAVRKRDALRPLIEQQANAKSRQEETGSVVRGLSGKREAAAGALERMKQPGKWVNPIEVAKLESSMAEIDKRLQAAIQKDVSATQDRLNAEHSISAVRIRAADESIRRTQDEIAMRKSMLQAIRDDMKSGRERFGMLDEGEQKRVLDLKRRFDAGEDIGVQGMQDVSQYGTADEREDAGAYYRKRSTKAGYDPVYLEKDLKQEKETQQDIARSVEIKLKDQRQLKITVEQDTDTIVEQIMSVLNPELDRLNESMRRTVQDELDKKNEKSNQDEQTQKSVTDRRLTNRAGVYA